MTHGGERKLLGLQSMKLLLVLQSEKENTLVYCYLIIHVIENSCMHQETGLLLNHMLRFEKKKEKRKLKSFKRTCSEHINMRG